MKAIILVGGFGHRLRAVLSNIPKPMAPIANRPFLSYLLSYLESQGITQVIFSVHYLRETIQNYFQSNYGKVKIDYAEEVLPLGTGGAIVHALNLFHINEAVFVLNGDTFVQLDYRAMFYQHQKNHGLLTIGLRSVENCMRYGKVIIENDLAVAFNEKADSGSGLINAGVYLLHPELFSTHQLPKQFSFEKDFLFPYISIIKPHIFVTSDYFIDIGIPADYARAQMELPQLA